MIRRRFLAAISVSTAIFGVVASGCESLRHRDETSRDDEESELPKEARDQHRSTRLPGALSSEASEIERDLGVH